MYTAVMYTGKRRDIVCFNEKTRAALFLVAALKFTGVWPSEETATILYHLLILTSTRKVIACEPNMLL